MLITCNFQAIGFGKLESILSACGMERVSGIVMENDKSYYYSNTPYYLLLDVTKCIYKVPSAVHISLLHTARQSPMGKIQMIQLIQHYAETTDKAVSKTDAVNATTSELEEGDAQTICGCGCQAEKQSMKTVAKVVVAGFVEMFADSADQTLLRK